jgi:hypothetical protein
LRLVRFAAADYVQRRLGCAPATSGVSQPNLTKRDLGTDASRLGAENEPGERPPITDVVTLRALLREVTAFAETFPEEMQRAFAMWLDDASFAEIAERLEFESIERARAAVRAAQARLRERFRGRWPELPDAAALRAARAIA